VTAHAVAPRDTQLLTDEQIVARVRAGDLAAFEEVMRRYNQRIFRIVRSIVKDDEETEDVMQDAYVSALSHLADFAGRARFSTWLTRIAVHEAFARLRRRHRQQPLDALHSESERESSRAMKTPEHYALQRELRLILENAILALPEHFRTVFVLREVEQLSVAETAETLELNADTVKTRLHRARNLLRDELGMRVDSVLPNVLEFKVPRCDRIVAGVFERISQTATP
jgi:RNA polymerase sigma-70 factor (ECF subfamily)